MRVPPLVAGLFLGFFISFVTSRFEEVLTKNIEVVYFIPFIVYMADAIGTQTQTIYARDLSHGKANFVTYLIKEIILGLIKECDNLSDFSKEDKEWFKKNLPRRTYKVAEEVISALGWDQQSAQMMQRVDYN
ncbi:hypothetical protein HY612_00180 [Candidatus Roizmanbacteria bacterium]|nr:hypothetical protein [Candidatus Roizmanbacteria bacterium]